MLEAKEIEKEVKELGSEVKKSINYEEILRVYKGEDEVVEAKTYMETIESLRKNTEALRLPSGLPGLDSIIEAFWEGNLVVVSGPTKEGKTTFCQTLTLHFSAMGQNCLWFPFDTPAEELISRFNEKVNIFLPQKNPPSKKLEWLEKRIIEGLAKFNTRIVFIDHLGMLTRSDNFHNYATELQKIVEELKQIAIRWRVIIFINHHIRKIDTYTIPTLSDLKDSVGVATDSDMVLMVWRKKKKTDHGPDTSNEGTISVLSNRRTGRTGWVDLVHQGDRFLQVGYEPPVGSTDGDEDDDEIHL